MIILVATPLFATLTWAQASLNTDTDSNRRVQEAAALFEKGRRAESEAIYQELLTKLQNSQPSSQLGLVLNGLSKISAADGDYSKALELAKQSGDVYRKVGDADGESHSLNNQGIAEIQLGHYVSAERALLAALTLSERNGDTENQVQVLNNLGSALYYPGSYSEAQRRYDQAMDLVKRNRDATWSGYWTQITSFNQATLFQRLGRYENALQIYRQVEQWSKNLTPSDLAHLYANLGALYRRLGDPYKALDTYHASQKLYEEQHDAGGELTVLKNIGIVYALDMDDLKRAEGIFKSAIALAQRSKNRREEMQAHLYLAETLFRAKRLAGSRAEFDAARFISEELGTSEEQWKSVYGLGKVEEASGSEAIAEKDYRQAIAIIEKTRSQLQLAALRSDFFADKREAYDALIALLMKKNDVSESFLFLEKSRARNFQDRIRSGASSRQDLFTLDRIRQTLSQDTALLEFWTSGDQIGLIWCTRQNAGLRLKRPSTAQLGAIRKYLDGMPNVLGADWRSRAEALNILLPEDTKALAGIHHLIIVPDGWISYVPFDLIPAVDGGNELSVERYDISYLPTAAILRRPEISKRRIFPPWTRELVAFGDPNVDVGKPAEDSGRDDEQQRSRLQFSAHEVLSVADLVHGRKKLFLGNNDVKNSFLDPAINNAFILHVSTHAFADGDNPENSRLLFSPESAGGDPDYVFLRELYDLNLGNVRLATISACDTERGKIIRGEGVQAFSRALLSAGAEASITTLWRVDDAATSEFMRQFYYMAVHEHRAKAEALRLTKLKLLRSNSKLSDPRLWAAFVLNGDGATPLPSVWSWGELALLLGGAVCALFAVVAALRLRSRSRIKRQNGARAVIG